MSSVQIYNFNLTSREKNGAQVRMKFVNHQTDDAELTSSTLATSLHVLGHAPRPAHLSAQLLIYFCQKHLVDEKMFKPVACG